MTNGKTTIKYEINFKSLIKNARINNKLFLHYDNSKSKINTIIRKNVLPGFVIEYLWQNKAYKKELIRNQKTLPPSIREDVVRSCIIAYSSSPWTSILRNFLKLHSPTQEELNILVNAGGLADGTFPGHDSIILECWEHRSYDSFTLGFDQMLLPVIIRNIDKEEHHKQIVTVTSIIIEKYPTLIKELFDTILSVNNDMIVRQLLIPVFKVTKLNDFAVDYLLSHTKKPLFNSIIKNAMHRENISDNMLAKLLLALD